MNNNGPAGKAYGTKVSVSPQDKMPAEGQQANGEMYMLTITVLSLVLKNSLAHQHQGYMHL